jgi:hypothetical protein
MWHKVKTVAENHGLDPVAVDSFARLQHARFKIINHDCAFPMVNTFEHDHFLTAFRLTLPSVSAVTAGNL